QDCISHLPGVGINCRADFERVVHTWDKARSHFPLTYPLKNVIALLLDDKGDRSFLVNIGCDRT
ncbi:MAG TPA: hypothetical protein V6C95_03535, partial [Coleofasciculaceae cyanobacterium]